MGGCWYVLLFFLFIRLGFGGAGAGVVVGGWVEGGEKEDGRVVEEVGGGGEVGKWGMGGLTLRRGGPEPRRLRMGIGQRDAEAEFP